MNFYRLCFCLLLGLMFHEPATAITFFDGTFSNTDWSALKIHDSTPGAAATFVVTDTTAGGNPGSYRQTQHTFIDGAIIIGHFYVAATVDPSDYDGISSIDYSYDLIHFYPDNYQAVDYRLLIEQGTYYFWSAGGISSSVPRRGHLSRIRAWWHRISRLYQAKVVLRHILISQPPEARSGSALRLPIVRLRVRVTRRVRVASTTGV